MEFIQDVDEYRSTTLDNIEKNLKLGIEHVEAAFPFPDMRTKLGQVMKFIESKIEMCAIVINPNSLADQLLLDELNSIGNGPVKYVYEKNDTTARGRMVGRQESTLLPDVTLFNLFTNGDNQVTCVVLRREVPDNIISASVG